MNNATLNRFFSLHFFLPFIIAALSLVHLALLHKDGSNNPLGIDSKVDKVWRLDNKMITDEERRKLTEFPARVACRPFLPEPRNITSDFWNGLDNLQIGYGLDVTEFGTLCFLRTFAGAVLNHLSTSYPDGELAHEIDEQRLSYMVYRRS